MTHRFVIHGRPMTKKNSLQKTRYGLVQGKAYREYAKDALWQLKAQRRPIKPIECAVTMTARYYMPNRKGWPDLFGLVQATADILEKAGVLEDDGFVATVGNSRIEGVSDWPRVEVTVTEPDWKEYSDLPDYEARNVEKIRRRMARMKRR